MISYGGGTASGNWDQTGVLRTNGSAASPSTTPSFASLSSTGCGLGRSSHGAQQCRERPDRGLCAHPGSTLTVINSTVNDNRIGLLLHGGSLDVADRSQPQLGGRYPARLRGRTLTIRYSDVWNPGGQNYVGTADRTGQNGNLAVDPKLRIRALATTG